MTRSEHFRSLCETLGVTVEHCHDTSEYHSDQKSRVVWVNEGDFDSSDEAYYAALHELGHIATQVRIYPPDESLPTLNYETSADGYVLDSEAQASRWALDHAGEQVSDDARHAIHEAAKTYLEAFRESYGTKWGRTMVNANFHPPPPDSGIERTAKGMCSIPENFSTLYRQTA